MPAVLQPDVLGVAFDSITGYRKALPIDEARQVLLATHVGGEVLDHWHGYPVRLVVPSRRGWYWVKWLTTIEILTISSIQGWFKARSL
jgi:DMSO/TMAO reductase YedYZ molybdopterin-dependent catalytic subunit